MNTKKITSKGSPKVFSDDELSAMRARSAELRAEEKAKKNRVEGERQALAAIAKMPEPDRSIGKRLHTIITSNAPTLWPKTWYGMPAYVDHDGKVVCFFQNASKFKYRYSTLGFQEAAKLDDGAMWPTSYAIVKLTPIEEKKIIALLKQAVR